jgi:small subunit ribosomal protein S6e
MANFKIVLSDQKTGKSTVHEVKDKEASAFLGLKINDVVNGSVLGVDGDIRIAGGSDRAGFPMRVDLQGGIKKYILLTKSVGFKKADVGERGRKLVRGNTITDDIYQINAVHLSKESKENTNEQLEQPKEHLKPEKKENSKEELPEVKKE